MRSRDGPFFSKTPVLRKKDRPCFSKNMGILICGLNGAGKSTLGRALAERLGCEFIDNEELYFPGGSFSEARSREEVVRLLEERIRGNEGRFVFSAVTGDYGPKLIAALDLVVVVEAPREVRWQRVRERSFRRFGARALPGGDLYERESAWFAKVESRPEDYVSKWLKSVDCPVARVDGTRAVEETVGLLMGIFENQGRSFFLKISDFEKKGPSLILKNPGSPEEETICGF